MINYIIVVFSNKQIYVLYTSFCYLILFLCLFFLSVKEKLTADPESEIATTSLRVSLLCPVNKNFIILFNLEKACVIAVVKKYT